VYGTPDMGESLVVAEPPGRIPLSKTRHNAYRKMHPLVPLPDTEGNVGQQRHPAAQHYHIQGKTFFLLH